MTTDTTDKPIPAANDEFADEQFNKTSLARAAFLKACVDNNVTDHGALSMLITMSAEYIAAIYPDDMAARLRMAKGISDFMCNTIHVLSVPETKAN